MKSLSFVTTISNDIPTSDTAGVTGSAATILSRYTNTVFRDLIIAALNDKKNKEKLAPCFQLVEQAEPATWLACVDMTKINENGLCVVQVKRIVYEHETDYCDPVVPFKPMVAWCDHNTMSFIVPRHNAKYAAESVVFPHEYIDEEHRVLKVGKFFRLSFDLNLDISAL